MRYALPIIAILFVILITVILLFPGIVRKQNTSPSTNEGEKTLQTKGKHTMQITSSAFENNAKIPGKYTCDAEGINPPLQFSGIPSDAKSLALIVDDPDAPSGTFVHWVIYNFPATVTEIQEGSMPESAGVGKNSVGHAAYAGPCPPSGTHHYHFKVYALDTQLDLGEGADKAQVEEAMSGHILDQAELVGLYR